MPKARVVARPRQHMGQKFRSSQALEEKQEKWHGVRRFFYNAVEGSAVKTLISSCIVLNTAVVVYETDLAAKCDGQVSECEATDAFTRICNMFFLTVFTLEMVARMYAHRKAYFTCPSDVFDMCIVIIGLAGSILGGALPNLSILRLFRVARVIRAFKVANAVDEVRVFISGIWCTCKAICVGSVLIFFCIFLFSIASVMLLNPVNQRIADSGFYDSCERCEVAYSSVSQSMLTLIQVVVMGDAWGIHSVPLVEEAPWTIVLFIVTSFSISLGLTNLVLAVILDQALENRDVNLHKQAEQKAKVMHDAQKEFMMLCAELDTDRSGSLSLSELLAGYEHAHFKAVLTMLDIQKDDLTHVFNILDEDKSGGLSYEEFATKFQALKHSDIHTMVSFTKHYVLEMYHMFQLQSSDLQELRASISHQSKQVGACARLGNVDSARKRSELPGCPRPGSADVQEPADAAAPGLPLAAAPPDDTRGDCREAGEAAAVQFRAQMQELRNGLESHVILLQESIIRDIELKTSVLQSLLLQGVPAPLLSPGAPCAAPRAAAGAAASRAAEGCELDGSAARQSHMQSRIHGNAFAVDACSGTLLAASRSEDAAQPVRHKVLPASFLSADSCLRADLNGSSLIGL